MIWLENNMGMIFEFLISRLDWKIETNLVSSCVIMLALFCLFTDAGQEVQAHTYYCLALKVLHISKKKWRKYSSQVITLTHNCGFSLLFSWIATNNIKTKKFGFLFLVTSWCNETNQSDVIFCFASSVRNCSVAVHKCQRIQGIMQETLLFKDAKLILAKAL